MTARLTDAQKEAMLGQLKNATPRRLGLGSVREFPENRAGVYLITSPDDTRTVYAGLSVRLRDRLRWHAQRCHANGGRGGKQDLVAKLEIDALCGAGRYIDYEQDGRQYLVRYLVVEDREKREDFERFVITREQPAFCIQGLRPGTEVME